MDDLVHIYEASSEDDAVMCRSRLEDAGIPVLIRATGNHVVSWDAIYPLPPFFFALDVRADDIEGARPVVEAYVQETALPEQAVEEWLTEQPAVPLEEHHRLMRRHWYYLVGMGFVWLNVIAFFVSTAITLFLQLYQVRELARLTALLHAFRGLFR
ncbi:MAG TPA: hypothetical protein VGM23_18185 [Armatimonadota bacterium]